MYCTNCGNYNPEEAKTCSACGTPLGTGSATAQGTPSTSYQPYNPQQSYGQSPYAPHPVTSGEIPGKGAGIASLILGIISLVFFCLYYISIPTGIAGIITGCIAVSKAKSAGQKNGMGLAGIICSIIGIIISIGIIIAAIGVVFSEFDEIFGDFPY